MIFIGLGNPGVRYRATRHNAGYIFLDYLARMCGKKFRTTRGYRWTKLLLGDKEIELIKPLCWMNNSGSVVLQIVKEKASDFLIILDDSNLALGRIRLRAKGSDGGHLGLRSIINALGYQEFPRLRIGIDHTQEDLALYVLSPFKRSERNILRKVIKEAIKGIEIMLNQGFSPAQNYINAINFTPVITPKK